MTLRFESITMVTGSGPPFVLMSSTNSPPLGVTMNGWYWDPVFAGMTADRSARATTCESVEGKTLMTKMHALSGKMRMIVAKKRRGLFTI